MNLENDFQKGVGALEDLYKLGGAKLAPVVNRIYYHFFNLQNERKEAVLDELPQMKNFISRSVIEMVRDYLSFNSCYRKVCFETVNDSYSLAQWNRLLEVLPATLAITNSFDFKGSIKVSFMETGLKIEGLVAIGEEIEKIRPEIYRKLREIIKNKSLLTFSLKPSAENYELSLWLDTSVNEQQAYCIDMSDEYDNLVLGMPDLFSNYVTHRQLKEEHTVLEITDHLELVQHTHIPDGNDSEREILHFSFLFRPVSIIIPRKGKLRPIDTLKSKKDSKSGRSIEKSKQTSFYFLDFFTIMSR